VRARGCGEGYRDRAREYSFDGKRMGWYGSRGTK
jgi:hypothetical protein